MPRLVRFIEGDEWPMSATKIQRFALRDRLPPSSGGERMIPADLVLAEDVMPLGHLLLRSARRDPEREALVFPDARLTYRQLTDRAWGIAKSLLALGVRPGEHVGFLMTNHPDLVATYFGISLAGAVVVPINARYRTTELRRSPRTPTSWPC